jgi:hypothetical protein
MMGSCTSAITKRHVNSRHSPRFMIHDVHSYEGMVVKLAAYSVYSVLSLHPGRSLRGKTHRSDPVSTWYGCFELHSVMKRRPELIVQTLVTTNSRWCSYLLTEAGGVHFRAA